MRTVIFLFASVLFTSCKKTTVETAADTSDQAYTITFTSQWKSPQFTVPANAHFTYFTGAVLASGQSLWQAGGEATAGIEAIAESGNQFALFEEVDRLIAAKKAMSQINIPQPPVNGSISRTVYCTSRFATLSFASMIAPSPDWLVGIPEINLYRNNAWLQDTTVQLLAYDGGTEQGDAFGYNNPESTPKQKITLLTPASATVLANGNPTLAPIATVRITKQ